MEPFIRLEGLAAAMPAANIDTDVIMPKAFLKGIDRSGLAVGLFHDLRFDADGMPRPEFILNRPEMAGTQILVVGPNFGCGSSREHAIWGLMQYGIRAIVGSGFEGMFGDNGAHKRQLLVTLADMVAHALLERVAGQPTRLAIDLERQRIEAPGIDSDFAIDQGIRRALLQGLDRIGETLTHADAIRGFEHRYHAQHPWLVEDTAS